MAWVQIPGHLQATNLSRVFSRQQGGPCRHANGIDGVRPLEGASPLRYPVYIRVSTGLFPRQLTKPALSWSVRISNIFGWLFIRSCMTPVPADLPVGEVEVACPVLGEDTVLTGADMVAEGALNGVADGRVFFWEM